jgi:polyketide cyclase/dehydrase/lipid transport protein
MYVSPNCQWRAEGVVDAVLERTWAAFDDLSLIPQYHPVVHEVEFPLGNRRRAPGVEYKCIIPTGPRPGWCVEKVIDHVPLRSSTVAFMSDSLGLSKLLDDFVTEITVEPVEGTKTRVTLRGFYTPRGGGGGF